IHRRLPAEPRESIWNKRSNETLDSKGTTKSVDDSKENFQIASSRSQISKNKGVSSSILIADDPASHYGSDSGGGGGIEIITSRTPFHDLNHDSDDSKSINVGSTALKVGASITMGSKFGVQNTPFVSKIENHNIRDYSYMKPQLYPNDGIYSSNSWQ